MGVRFTGRRTGRGGFRLTRSYHRGFYDPGFEADLALFAFGAGLDTPMLISRKLNPLRSNSSSFMADFLPDPIGG